MDPKTVTYEQAGGYRDLGMDYTADWDDTTFCFMRMYSVDTEEKVDYHYWPVIRYEWEKQRARE